MEIDRLRLLDFFLLFPSAIKSIRIPQHLRKWKNAFQSRENAYLLSAPVAHAFRQVEGPFWLAVGKLVSKGILDDEVIARGTAALILSRVPTQIASRIAQRNEDEAELVGFLVSELGQLPLSGTDGLKSRTKLLEYRYDSP